MEGIENLWRKTTVASLPIKLLIVWNKHGNSIPEAVEEHVCD